MAFFRKIRIRKKMLLTFVPLALIPMFLLMAVSYNLFRSQMQGYTAGQVYESILQVNRHVDSYLEELDRLSMLPYYQPELLSIMLTRDDTDLLQRYYSTKLAESIISQSLINPREDLQSVFLYRDDGRLIFISRENESLNENYDFHTSYWYAKAAEGNGKAVFLGPYRDTRFAERQDRFISVTRLIKSYDSHKVLGAILIDADYSGLESLFNLVDLGDKANLVVLDQDNRMIYQQNDQYLPFVSEVNLDAAASGKQSLNNGNIMSSYSRSSLTGWKVVGLVSSQSLNKDILTMRNLIFMLTLCMFAAVGFASIAFSHHISKPLFQLKRLMNEVQRGNFNVSMPKTRSEDEIGIVANAFNNMSSRIQELIHQNAEVRVQQKQAELNHLKSQIRPHFLYNTLESIRSLAELREYYEIARLTTSLGEILRYSIRSHDQLVTIRSELYQVQNYLSIQENCASFPLRWVIDVEPSLLDAYTMPLLIQPIVENAVGHGFDGIDREGRIVLSASRMERDMLIEITDNGIGMPQQTVQALNEALSAVGPAPPLQEADRFGIGLLNVAYRLHLLFGDPYGMMLESEEGVGTTVFMRVPYIADPQYEKSLLSRKGDLRHAENDDRGR